MATQICMGKTCITQRSSSEGVVVIHKLAPSDDHHSASVVVEPVVRMHGAGDHTRQWQVATGVGDTGRVDAVRE